jgi:hypothetical protein
LAFFNLGGSSIPTWILFNHPRICCLLFKLSFDVLSVICRLHNHRSPVKIPFYLVPSIVFSFRAHAFFYLGIICRFSWNGTYVSHWMFHDNRHMNTSADVSKFQIVLVRLKCWILLMPVLGGVDGNLHFPVPSMNRLNQTEPATFTIVPCWAFLRDSVFLYFMVTSVLFLPFGGRKKYPRTFNQRCYIFDPWRSFRTT